MKTSLTKLTRRLVLLLTVYLVMPLLLKSQTYPTATELASKMTVGWNLGNSLEVPDGETAWGNPATTQLLIDSVKAAGFNTIRIPCAWDGYANSSTHQISSSWFARVKQVVDYCINNDMYVIINIHWDGGWLEENPLYSAQSEVNEKQEAYWTQIANYFINYDEHLLFAGTNEVHANYSAPSSENIEVQESFNQTFVDAVRATGGYNAYRNLIVQTYNTNAWNGLNYFTLPTDQVSNRLFVEIHHYDPYDFTLNSDDSSACILWGTALFSSGVCSWGQEDYVDDLFGQLKSTYVNAGVPVIMGEFGAGKRTNLTGSAYTNHVTAREYYLNYVTSSAKNNGIIPIYWDNGSSANMGFALFNRSTGAVVDKGALNALITGAGVVVDNDDDCTPTEITPYLQIDGGSWTSTTTATVNEGSTVVFGPHPTQGGSWSWSGPNNYSSTSRELEFTNITTSNAGNYIATYTNTSGCSSTTTFSLTVNSSSSNTTATLTKHGGGSSSQAIDLGDAITDFYYSWTDATSVSVEGMPAGIDITIDVNALTVSFSGTATESGTFSFTVTTVGADVNATMGGTITVNATDNNSDTGSNNCDNPTSASLPLTISGEGTYCYVVSGTISYVNSWGLSSLTINGVDYTNTWSNSMPDAINGAYYISYSSSNGWSQFEAPALKSAKANIAAESIHEEIQIYPNPFTGSEITIDLNNAGKTTTVNIYDLVGHLLDSQVYTTENIHSLTVQMPEAGKAFIIKLITEKQVITQKVMRK